MAKNKIILKEKLLADIEDYAKKYLQRDLTGFEPHIKCNEKRITHIFATAIETFFKARAEGYGCSIEIKQTHGN